MALVGRLLLLTQLEKENERLKRVLAEAELERGMRKNVVAP